MSSSVTATSETPVEARAVRAVLDVSCSFHSRGVGDLSFGARDGEAIRTRIVSNVNLGILGRWLYWSSPTCNGTGSLR